MRKAEVNMQKVICRYLRQYHPKVLYYSDLSGLYVSSIGVRKMMKQLRSGSGWPDLMIFEPRSKYHGLMIELKAEGKGAFKKDGSLKSDPHLQEQNQMHEKLREKGYFVTFSEGIEETIDIIEKYLKMQ